MAGGKGKRKVCGERRVRSLCEVVVSTASRGLFCVAQKWNKGKVREKLANAVLFDDKTYERLMAEVPKVRLATRASCGRFPW
jgi:hypothetical protein